MIDIVIPLEEDLHEVHDKYYPSIPENVFLDILALDPTFKENTLGKYGKWLLVLFKKDPSLLDDAQEITHQLEIFDKYKMKYDVQDRDINRVKNLPDLIALNHKYETRADKSDYELRAKDVPGVEITGSSPNWEVYRPTTWDASKYLRGQNAVWCTGRHNDSRYWKEYTEQRGDRLYIFINKKNRDDKYQVAINPRGEVEEFRDANNGGVDFVEFLAKNIELLDILLKDPFLKGCQEVGDILMIQKLQKGQSYEYSRKNEDQAKRIKAFITKIELPEGIKLNNEEFAGFEALTEVTIPEHVTDIPRACFANCVSLIKVILPKSLESIGSGAFLNCIKLQEINLPQNLKTIGFGAFYGCDDVTIYAKHGLKLMIKHSDAIFLKQHIKWED